MLKNISKFDKTVNYLRTDDCLDDEINHMEKYDGASSTVESRSENYATEDEDEFKAYLNQIKISFQNSYKQMDKLLSRGRNERSKSRWSGVTSVSCIIENIENKKSWLHIANCGTRLS